MLPNVDRGTKRDRLPQFSLMTERDPLKEKPCPTGRSDCERQKIGLLCGSRRGSDWWICVWGMSRNQSSPLVNLTNDRFIANILISGCCDQPIPVLAHDWPDRRGQAVTNVMTPSLIRCLIVK